MLRGGLVVGTNFSRLRVLFRTVSGGTPAPAPVPPAETGQQADPLEGALPQVPWQPVENTALFRSRMLRALKDRRYDQILNEYELMLEANVSPDMLALNCIVEAKAHSHGASLAEETLQVMLSAHAELKPNAATYAALMKPSEKDGSQQVALALYDEMISRGVQPSVEVYNTLITTCTAVKDFSIAGELFTEMREQGIMPKMQTYLRYIYGCFHVREIDKAFQMLCTMEAEWRVPDRKEYERMLAFFKRHGHADGKERCLKGIMDDLKNSDGAFNRLHPEVVSSLFQDAQERRKPDQVLKLAKALLKGGTQLGRFQQVGVVFAHLQMSQPVDAFTRLIELYEQGHTLPDRAHESIIHELAKQASAVDESYYLLESRKQDVGSVPLPAVNTIIEACAMMGDLDRAFATWAELDELDLAPDVSTYNALLHTCVRAGEITSGLRLLNRMVRHGIVPNAATFAHQTSLHIVSKEDGLALRVLQSCKDAGVTPSGRMYAALTTMLLRNRRRERAQDSRAPARAHHAHAQPLPPESRTHTACTICTHACEDARASSSQELLGEMEAAGHPVANGLREKVANGAIGRDRLGSSHPA